MLDSISYFSLTVFHICPCDLCTGKAALHPPWSQDLRCKAVAIPPPQKQNTNKCLDQSSRREGKRRDCCYISQMFFVIALMILSKVRQMKANNICRPGNNRKIMKVPTQKCHLPLNLEAFGNTSDKKTMLHLSATTSKYIRSQQCK